MSESLAKVLSGLKNFASSKIKSIDGLAISHEEWLNTVVGKAHRNIEASVRKPQEEDKSNSSVTKKVKEHEKLEIKGKDENDHTEPNSIASLPVDDDQCKKPRRGARKKRVVDYYDGPDRDVKRSKDSGKKLKSPKVRENVDMEQSTSPPMPSNPRGGDKMDPDASNEEPCLVSKNDSGAIPDKSMKELPKKGKVVKKAEWKAKNAKRTEIKNKKSLDDSVETKSLSNKTKREKSQKKKEQKLTVIRLSDTAKEISGHIGQTEKKYSEHMASPKECVSLLNHNLVDPDSKIASPHSVSVTADEAQQGLHMSQDQISGKRFSPGQILKDDGSLAKPDNPSKRSSGIINAGVDKEHTKDGDTPVFAANLASKVKTLLPYNEMHVPSDKISVSIGVEKKELDRNNEDIQKENEMERVEAERVEAERVEAERVEAERLEQARETKRIEALQRQKEEELMARQKAKEEEEKRRREEKARRLEEHKKRRKLEAEAAARSGSAGTNLVGPSTGSGGSLAAAKERLAKIQQQAAMLKGNNSTSDKVSLNGRAVSGTPKISAMNITGNVITPQPLMTMTSPDGKGADCSKSNHKSYEISPYKSDHDSDDDVPKKPVPDWARGKALMAQLVAQMYVDPDEVFQQHAKTCSLDQVFGNYQKPGKQNFDRRSSSGNWIEDRVTWREEMGYKKAMGYI